MRLMTLPWLLLGLLLNITTAAAEEVGCRQDSLRISIIPVKNMSQLIEEYQPLASMLSQGLGMPVRLLHTSSYDGVIDAVVSGGADIAKLGPASYLLAWQSNPDIEPFATLAAARGHFSPGGSYYHSLLLVRSDNDVSAIEDLRGRRVALSDPVSTSGALIPRYEFSAEVGEPLGSYFSGQVYAGSHDRALDALLEGRVDAAFVSSKRADEYLARGLIDTDTLNILWRSEPLHHDPLVFSGAICEELKQRIRSLMATPSPVLEAFLHSQQAEGVAPVSHAAYEPLLPLLLPE